jgi:hypothetical protein
MNVLLHQVVGDITGTTGKAMGFDLIAISFTPIVF